MGYVPLFESLTSGTLCGRWPDVGLWPIVLSLADRFGTVDVTVDYLSRITGLGVEDVRACMTRFCGPDPGSRSPDAGGARLILIDPTVRDWGWHVVNHGKYREKARKAAFDSERAADGRNRTRMAHRADPRRPAMTRDDPRSSARTRADPPSDSDSDSNKTKIKKSARKRASPRTPIPEDLTLTDAQRSDALARFPDADPDRMFDQFRAHHQARGTELKSWSAAWITWVGNAEKFGYPKMQTTARRWQ